MIDIALIILTFLSHQREISRFEMLMAFKDLGRKHLRDYTCRARLENICFLMDPFLDGSKANPSRIDGITARSKKLLTTTISSRSSVIKERIKNAGAESSISNRNDSRLARTSDPLIWSVGRKLPANALSWIVEATRPLPREHNFLSEPFETFPFPRLALTKGGTNFATVSAHTKPFARQQTRSPNGVTLESLIRFIESYSPW